MWIYSIESVASAAFKHRLNVTMEERNDEIGPYFTDRTILYRWSMTVESAEHPPPPPPLPFTIQTPQTAKSIWIRSDRSLEQRECLNCTGYELTSSDAPKLSENSA